MKNSFFLSLAFIVMSDVTFGQTRKMFFCGHDEDPSYSQVEICKKLSENSFASDEEAKEVVDVILNAVGLPGGFTVMECGNIKNAVAVNFEDKKGGLIRYILYDNTFLESIGNRSGDKYWSSTAILAHEVGHHLLGHTLNENGNNRPDKEIQADEFSGLVLGKLGATLKQAQSAIKQLRSEDGNSTHPAKKLRLAAVKKGWEKANAENIHLTKSKNAIEQLKSVAPTKQLILDALLNFSYDVSMTEPNTNEAYKILQHIGATDINGQADYWRGRFSSDYWVAIFVKSYGKNDVYGLRFSSEKGDSGRFFGSNDSYFEIERPK